MFIAILWTALSANAAQPIFRDDFNGSSLNSQNWSAETSGRYLGRTQFFQTPVVADGMASLALNTYDPRSPGNVFAGTEMRTNQLFSRGNGLEFEARLRLSSDTPSGAVFGFFTYLFENPNSCDEIDTELLTRNNSNSVGVFNNWVEPPIITPDSFNDGVTHLSQVLGSFNGVNRNDFNTYTIRWLPDHTEWLVNGTTVYSMSQVLADAPMSLRFNVWVPDGIFAAAYDPSFQPDSNAIANESYFFDIDYVQVAAIPEVESFYSLAGGLMILAGFILFRLKSRQPAVVLQKIKS